MKNNKIIIKSIVYGLFICLIILLMFFFALLSPYESWDPLIKQVDYDVLGVLKFFWIIITITNITFTFLTKTHKKTFFVIFLLLTILSMIKLISLFFV